MKRLGSIMPETSENLDINMSPLIDMVFLLLIFFMVTTTFVQQTGVEVTQPTAASAAQVAEESLLIGIGADGRVMFGGQEVGLEGVRGLVERRMRGDGLPVVVLADEAVPAGLLVGVIDACKEGGAKVVSIAAEVPVR